MASPGGWNLKGLDFSQTETQVRVFMLGTGGAEEVPLDTINPESESAHETALKQPVILVLESRGGNCVGFQAPRDFIQRTGQAWGMPPHFLGMIQKPGSLPLFAHLVEESQQGIKAINLGFRWGPGHSNFLVFFCRFEPENSTLRAFLSSRDVLQCPSVLDLMASEEDVLREHPLELFSLLIDSCRQYVDCDAQKENKRMIEIGISLQVMDKQWASGWGFKAVNPSANMSSTIYHAMNSVAWLKKNCCELIDIGQHYVDFANGVRGAYRQRIPKDGVHDVVLRAGHHRHMLAFLETMLASQFNFHSNLLMQHEAQSTLAISKASQNIAAASQKDALSMKTVSYLTLVFLPATFVSAIFSTTIFDFQNWKKGASGEPVVSPGWWVFVVSCIGATVITISVWLWWHHGDIKRWREYHKWDDSIEGGS